MGVMGYCDPAGDPSLMIVNSEPAPRTETWSQSEARQLVERAWQEGFHGLSALMASAWDSMLSPVDVRGLTPSQMAWDDQGVWFQLKRTKTGQAAAAT